MTGSIRFEVRESVGWLGLNRPDVLNAQDASMIGEIMTLCEDVEEDESIRALILYGEGGKAFSAGGDLKEFGDLTAPGIWDGRHVERIADLAFPTIAAIEGYAIGGGLELALACDIRIASEDSRFGLPEVGVGIIPGWGGTQRLPRLVGPGFAREMILTGGRIDSKRALEIGLVNRVVENGTTRRAAGGLAAEIVQNGPLATRFAKQAMHSGLDHTLSQGLELEGNLYVLLESTEDRMEGITAFREKRRPSWKGR